MILTTLVFNQHPKESYENFSPQKRNIVKLQELGIDSGGFGRLISKMRQHRSLGQVDLQMLFEHPTVPWMDGYRGDEQE